MDNNQSIIHTFVKKNPIFYTGYQTSICKLFKPSIMYYRSPTPPVKMAVFPSSKPFENI